MKVLIEGFCKKKVLLIVLFLIGVFASAIAMEEPLAILRWTPNPPEEEVEAYTVYVGSESRFSEYFQGYEFEIDVFEDCFDDECLCDLPDPPYDGSSYYVSVVARNIYGLSSDYSVEVSYGLDLEAASENGSIESPLKISVSGGSGGGGSVGGCFFQALHLANED